LFYKFEALRVFIWEQFCSGYNASEGRNVDSGCQTFSCIPFKRLMGIPCYIYKDLHICVRMGESAFPLQVLKQVAKFHEIRYGRCARKGNTIVVTLVLYNRQGNVIYLRTFEIRTILTSVNAGS
jgi:hypothetical protein